MRQRSAARRRASATIAFLRAAAEVLRSEQRSPLEHSLVIGLEATHPPGELDHQAAQTWIAVLGD